MYQAIRFKKSILSSCITAFTVAGFAVSAYADDQTPEKKKEVVEEVVVTGIRASQEAAVDVKRKAANIVDSIVAEDIGKLPDVTIADSLQRITGVQVDRTAGEGTSLNVRGMPQVLTTLNGEQFLSPWSITGVQANYSDVPAGMIKAVDVNKSQSANMLAGGIAGSIDLKTHRGLDMKNGWTASAGFENSEGKLTKDPNHDYNLFGGFNNGDVAFTLAGFSSLTNSADYQVSTQGQGSRLAFANQGGDPLNITGNDSTNRDRFFVPNSYGPQALVMERERRGLSGSFQAHVSDSLTLTAENFYTRMDQYDRGVVAAFNDGSNNGNYGALLKNGTVVTQVGSVPANGSTAARDLYAVEVAHISAADFISTTQSEQNHTGAHNSNIQLDFDNGGKLTGTLRYVYSTAKKDYVKAQFQQGTPYWYQDWSSGLSNPPLPTPYDVTIDNRAEFPTYSYVGDLSSAALLKKYQAFAHGETDIASLSAVRLDGSYKFDDSVFSSVDFGIRQGTRKVDSAQFDWLTPTAQYHNWDGSEDPTKNPALAGLSASQIAALDSTPLPGARVWQRYPDWADFSANKALASTVIKYTDFGPFKGFEGGVAAVNPKSLDNVNGFMNSVYPGSKEYLNPAYSYRVTETADSAYFQTNFNDESGLAGVPFTGNFGVQVIKTDRTVWKNVVPNVATYTNSVGGGYDLSQGYNSVFLSSGVAVSQASFTNVLPSANINFFPVDDVILRLAAAETITRNDLFNVGSGPVLWTQQYAEVDPSTGKPGTAFGPGGGNDQGNVNISPWKANNYNASAEWYFDKGAILGLGIFYIDVKTADQSFQQMETVYDSFGIQHSINVWKTQAVSAAPLKGLELGYKQAYSFLPGFLSGFGSELNFTYSDSDSGMKDLNGTSMPLQSNSKYQANAVLWYQKNQLSARIAYNWRSAEFIGASGLNTNEAAISMGTWYKPIGYLDASVNYDISENFTVYLQATNLTSSNQRSYAQFEQNFDGIRAQEERTTIGIRLKY